MQRLARTGDAGVVVDDVDASVSGERALDGGFYLRVFGDVTGEADVAVAEFARGGRGLGLIERDDHDLGSFAGVGGGAVKPNPGRAAGEEN